jgi:hypothetical protein
MSSDNQYTALGPAIVGFQTNGTNINRGAEIAGKDVGVKGTCQGAFGDGVQGFGGNAGGKGVLGQGGDGRSGVVGGIGVLGRGGDSQGVGFGPGVVGIDGKNVPPNDAQETKDIGVFGLGHTGVVGVGAPHDPPDWISRGQVGVYGVGSTGVVGKGLTGVTGISLKSTGVLGQSTEGLGVWGVSDRSHGVFGDNAASKKSGGQLFDRPAGCYGITFKNRGVAGIVGIEGKVNDPSEVDPWAIGVYGSSAAIPGENPRQPINSKGWAGFFAGPVGIYGGLAVAGFKSAAVPHPDGSHRLLYSLECPESWFEDFGEARLVNGKADVKLEKDFAKVVSTGSYHVFLTPCGDSKGLYIASRNSRGFTVKEQQGGKSTINFAYRIVARRKDIETPRLAKIELPKIKQPTAAAKGRKQGTADGRPRG